MTDKMIRFLNSIHVSNVDDFDMDFEMVGYNRFDKKRLDMVIVKQTPWKYSLLREFQDCLQNIEYKYLLRFSYLVRPNFRDVETLFEDWYQTLYRLPHNLEVTGSDDGYMKIEYQDEAEQEQYKLQIEDFRAFLDFINYDFVITETVKPKEDEITISDRKMKKLVKEADVAAEETISTVDEVEANDASVAEELIERDREELVKNAGDAFLEQAKRNYEAMQAERKRARLNKRGNYQPIDNIDSINGNSGSVDFNGKIFSIEIKEFGGRKRLNVGVGDEQGGAIYINMYENSQVNDEVIKNLVRNTNVRVRGVAHIDDYTKTLQVKGHYIDILPPDEVKPEEREEHRVELHLHTTMSSMDGVGTMED